jgi:ribosomal protein S18 acetylase RimI-like enzyme
MNKLVSYSEHTKFMFDAESLLLDQEVKNNLILGVLYASDHTRNVIARLILFKDGQPTKVAVVNSFMGGTLLLSLDWKESELEPLVNYFKLNSIKLHGVNAYVGSSQLFAQAWCAENNLNVDLLHRTQILALGKFKPLDTELVELRLAAQSEVDLICEYYQQFIADTHPNSELPNLDWLVESALLVIDEQRGYFLVNKELQLVGYAEVARKTPNYWVISSVEVLPFLRGKGYGKLLISRMCQFIAANKKTPALFVDKNNPLTMNLYYGLGFELIDENEHLVFKNNLN